MKKRILSILLTLCMVLPLLPTAAFAGGDAQGAAGTPQAVAEKPAAKAVQLGNDALSPANNLYFGCCKNRYLKWNILDTKTNTGEDGLFLTADDVIYNGDQGPVRIPYHEDGSKIISWQECTSRQWCQKFATVHGTNEYSAFTDKELETILLTTENVDKTMNAKDFLKDDRVFLMSDNEYNNKKYTLNRMVRYRWITRTPSYEIEDKRIIKSHVGIAIQVGDYKEEGIINYNTQDFDDIEIRPSMNLDASKIFMVSSAKDGKQSTAGDSNLTAVADYTGNEWKATLLDENRHFSIEESSAERVRKNLSAGNTVRFFYNGAGKGSNEYITAMIVDTDDRICYYGRVCKTDNTNFAKITVPADIATGKYKLRIFNEQYNGDYVTDYISNSVDFDFNVAESIQFGTGRLTGYKYGYDTVYYGEFNGEPVPWRILDTKTNIGGEGLFLLSEKLLGTGIRGQVYFDISAKSNQFQGSDAQKWCRNFADTAFGIAERAELLPITKSDADFGGEFIPYPGKTDILKDDTVFFLSAAEVSNADYGFTDNTARSAMFGSEAGRWWLRSRYFLGYDNKPSAGAIGYGGNVGNATVDTSCAARPAVNMKTDNILFISAINSGKAEKHADEVLTEVAGYTGSEWKLTLLDKSRNNFTASLSKTTDITAGEEIEVTFSGAKRGANEYVSAMILDENGKLLYYGRIISDHDSGTRRVTVPSDLKNRTYTFRLFSEQYNGDRKTDYAGNFVDIPFTVSAPDTTKPVLIFRGVERTSTTTANVYFSCGEAGYYYLSVDASPDTTGKGKPCAIVQEKVWITGLKPGKAAYVYIIVKDRAGNESDMCQALIPADAKYSVTLHTDGGIVAAEKNVKTYTCGKVTALPTAADVTRAGYTFAGWYTDDDFSGDAVTEINARAVGDVKFYAKWEVCDQFSLADGGTYYFDLSGMNIPGTVNTGTESGAAPLPDSTLHYVPFTYTGVVYAYKIGAMPDTTYTDKAYAKANRYAHSLFVAENNVTNLVSWEQLNEKGMIFGTEYIANSITYSLRTLSAGSDGYAGSTATAAPLYNEWDSILNKNENYLKNWEKLYSWGQDVFKTPPNEITISANKVLRGWHTSRSLDRSAQYADDANYVGFRPALDVLHTDTLGADGLKVVTLDLNGGKLGDNAEDIQIIVKNGNTFTAPASEGLTAPTGYSTAALRWRDGNGKLYAPGDSVPSDVAKLTALFTFDTYTVTLHTNGGTVADGKNITGYTYGQGATLPTADDMTYTGHTFQGWYDNEDLSGSPVTAIGDTEAGNREYWAKWETKRYTVTVKPENGKADIVITQDYGTPITAPDLTKAGYTFVGWDKTFPTTMPAENLTVTALWLDNEAPTCEISIGTSRWREFLNNITFGLFFKDTQTVTVTAADTSGETVTIAYLLSEKELTKAELAGKIFTAYTAPFTVRPDNEYVIYAKLTDANGNSTYINTNGIVLDKTAPVVSGIEDGKTYCAAPTVTVDEKYINFVKVNGKEVSLDRNNQFVLSPASGKQTIVVTDKAGNETIFTVTVNDGHTGGTATCKEKATCEICGGKYGEHADHSFSLNWSTDDERHWHECTLCNGKTDEADHADENKDHKCDTCGKTLSDHTGGTATCKEKAKCDVCGAEYGELDGGNHSDMKYIEAKAATKDAEGNIEYRYCADCGKYFADKDGAKEITKADTVIAKLPEEKPTEEKPEEKPTEEKPEEKPTEEKPEEKPTEEKPEEKPTEDKPAETNPTSPKTGDTSNLALWFALLFISGGAVTVTTIIGKTKKAHVNQK